MPITSRSLVLFSNTAKLGPLFDFSEASCGRITEGSYVSADLQSATWFPVDTIRLGSRGVLVERAFVNHSKTAVEVGASWSAANGTGVGKVAGSASAGTAPDGSTPAIMTYGLASNSRLTQTIGTGIPDGIPITLTGFFRGAAADNAHQPFINSSIDSDIAIPNGTWVRHVKIGVSGAAISDVVGFDNGNAWHAAHSLTNQVIDAWACCCNEGSYPMTPTRSVGGSFTSGEDVVVFLAPQIPERFLIGKWSVDITPEWAPADLSSDEIRWICTVGIGAQEGLRVRHNGSNVVIEALSGGIVVATSPALTGTAREVTRTITVDPEVATVAVDEDTGNIGTPWEWTAGEQVRFGGVLGSSGNEFDGYINSVEAI